MTIVLTTIVASSAGAGVPGSSLVTTLIVLNAIGLGPNAAAGIALVAGIDRPLDMCRTTVNTFSNLVGAVVIAPRRRRASTQPDDDALADDQREDPVARTAAATSRAGEIVVCDVDCVVGTDGSGPMAIDYFEQMGGDGAVRSVARVLLARSLRAARHAGRRARFTSAFATSRPRHGATVFDVGDGISHQVSSSAAWSRPAIWSSAPTATP